VLREKANGILVLPDEPLFLNVRTRIVELAARHRLPAFYGAREFVDAGGLMSYGENLASAYRNAASYVRRVANGADPALMPVAQPTRFELMVNAKTASSLGLVIPQAILVETEVVR
jgi:putative ABC transport system substrate-binding protein